jgi:hypothetical protein
MKDILLDIVTISECLGLDLKKMGDRYVCSCPLHKDDTPSFTIYPKTNSFFCYSCHTGGTPLELAKILEPNIRTWSDLVRWYNTVIMNGPLIIPKNCEIVDNIYEYSKLLDENN